MSEKRAVFEWNFAGVAQGETDDLATAKRVVSTWARANPNLVEKPSTIRAGLAVWRLLATQRAGQLILSWKVSG